MPRRAGLQEAKNPLRGGLPLIVVQHCPNERVDVILEDLTVPEDKLHRTAAEGASLKAENHSRVDPGVAPAQVDHLRHDLPWP